MAVNKKLRCGASGTAFIAPMTHRTMCDAAAARRPCGRGQARPARQCRFERIAVPRNI
ncbi:hypothetical protein C7S16_7278 [Burkholderia thailandensis]|uniref:Uncharacterized protein n=1 Tax=Burkholderia thailandensis TaxID=57975 RepID=A0AAW9CME0_BURTH|nr:hypothetical protein [Burkholderia thailandensis]MDW9251820.1 hypothetical protein [Burkholderia thailandensis]